MKRVVVLGGGVGGTIVANIVARRAKDADVTVVDKTGQHVYQPGYLYVAFDRQQPEEFARPESKLLHKRIRLIIDEAVRVDDAAKVVHLKSGTTLPYDYLVIATGARIAPEEIPGHEGSYHFYSAEASIKLREALERFQGGRVVVAIGGVPYKCPPAPAEAACQLDYYFTRRGIRDKVTLQYLSPIARLFPIEGVSPVVEKVFEARRIQHTTFFNVERVDPSKMIVCSLEGEEVPYDLLILVPPHHGERFAQESGLTDPGGWISTDRFTMQVKGHEGSLWALGDATDIPISKAGAVAHYQAKVVGANLAALCRGESPEGRYDGRVLCFCDAGFHRGIAIRFDYEHPPAPPTPSLRHYLMKVGVNRLYWRIVPKARM